MKKNKFLILIIGIIIILIGCESKKTYTTIITNFNEITRIKADTLAQYNNIKIIVDKVQMKEIYDIFYDKKTKMASLNDNPNTPDELYLVSFMDENENSTSAYIYKRKNKYFIEQPYNGIYEINESEYNKIKNIIIECDNSGAKSKVIINDKDVTLSIKKNTLTNGGATLILSNLTNNEYTYGKPYYLEIKKNDEWYELLQIEPMYFILPAYSLKAHEKIELEIDWSYGYDTLAPGTYRVVKSVNPSNDESSEDNKLYVAAEFTIEK